MEFDTEVVLNEKSNLLSAVCFIQVCDQTNVTPPAVQTVSPMHRSDTTERQFLCLLSNRRHCQEIRKSSRPGHMITGQRRASEGRGDIEPRSQCQ